MDRAPDINRATTDKAVPKNSQEEVEMTEVPEEWIEAAQKAADRVAQAFANEIIFGAPEPESEGDREFMERIARGDHLTDAFLKYAK